MGSTSQSFFSKFMRSDGKSKKQKRNDVSKRNSMPAPEWFNTADSSSFLRGGYQDRPRDNREPPPPVTSGQRQDYGHLNNRKPAEKPKKSKKGKERGGKSRRSSSLAFWLCMSGNTDTLERGTQPLPAKPDGKGKGKKGEDNTQGNAAVNGVKLREKGKKGKKDPSKRHSAPASELFCVMEANRNKEGNWDKNSRDEPSKTRYRIDGTLERPYVFPSGLTFNGENRRSKGYALRREIQPSKHGPASVEVHPSPTSARRRNFDGLEYDESEFSEDYDDFDVRKQFYLRYDSNRHKQSGGRRNRYSMPVMTSGSGEGSHVYFGINDESFDSDSFMGQSKAANGQDRDLSFRSEDPSGSEWGGRYDRIWRDQRERSAERTNRYSLPPDDLGCVYMRHSNEHLEFVGLEEEEFQNEASSKYEHLNKDKADSRKRFSLPTESLEIKIFNSEENTSRERIALPKGLKNCIAESAIKEQESKNSVHEKQDSNESMDVVQQSECHRTNRTQTSTEEKGLVPCTSSYTDNHNDESSKDESRAITITSETLDIKETTQETSITSAEEVKGEGGIPPMNDVFNLHKPMFQKNPKQSPFSRNLGRASCMPGNKRFIPPPPPRHTPPRDVMDSAQTQISGLVVHRECQASLAGDTETLTMEEKDLSLKRGTTSPIYKHPSSHIILESATTSFLAENKNDIDSHEYKINGADAKFREHEDSVGSCQEERVTIIPSDENLDPNSHKSNISSSNVQNSMILQPSEQASPRDSPISCQESRSQVTNCHINENVHHDNIEKVVTPENTPEVVQPGIGPDPAAVTSTPKASRRQKQTENKSMETASETKPTPPPRKRLSAILSDKHSISHGEETYNRSERAQSSGSSTSDQTPPVPRKRRNKIGTFKSASVDSPGHHISTEKPASHKRTALDGLGVSVSRVSAKSDGNKAAIHRKDKSEVQGKMENLETGKEEVTPVACRTTKSQLDSEHNDSNIYEEIAEVVFLEADETAKITSPSSYRRLRNHPSPTSPSPALVRRSSSHGLSKFTELLPPVADIMRLAASPRARRRYSSALGSSSECLSFSPRPYFSGLSASLGDMLGAFDEATDSYRGHTNGRRCREKMPSRDDDAWAADDEMSVYDDAAPKKSSSAGDLLRSTSIADRPLALSKRRHQRKHDRKCQSQLFSSTETDDGLLGRGSNDDIFDHPAKNISQWSSRKHRVNTTDSGLDSDFLSPSTSPDPRGNHLTQQGSEAIEECFRRQNSIQQKAWEIRLRKKQWLRRGRSKENLSASTPNLASYHSKSSTRTVV